jgi:hypothetical protein
MSRPAPRNGQALGPRWPKVPPGVRSRPTFPMRDGAAAARLAHNQEVGGASPPPASNSPFRAAAEAHAAVRRAAGAHSLPGCSSLDWRGLTAPPLSHSYATHHSELKQQIAQV